MLNFDLIDPKKVLMIGNQDILKLMTCTWDGQLPLSLLPFLLFSLSLSLSLSRTCNLFTDSTETQTLIGKFVWENLAFYPGSLIIVRGQKGERGIHCNACAKLYIRVLCVMMIDDLM